MAKSNTWEWKQRCSKSSISSVLYIINSENCS